MSSRAPQITTRGVLNLYVVAGVEACILTADTFAAGIATKILDGESIIEAG